MFYIVHTYSSLSQVCMRYSFICSLVKNDEIKVNCQSQRMIRNKTSVNLAFCSYHDFISIYCSILRSWSPNMAIARASRACYDTCPNCGSRVWPEGEYQDVTYKLYIPFAFNFIFQARRTTSGLLSILINESVSS